MDLAQCIAIATKGREIIQVSAKTFSNSQVVFGGSLGTTSLGN